MQPTDPQAILAELVILLMKRARESAVTAETLRALLVQHGVISQEDYEKARPAAGSLWDQTMAQETRAAQEAATDATLRRLLESLDSKPQ